MKFLWWDSLLLDEEPFEVVADSFPEAAEKAAFDNMILIGEQHEYDFGLVLEDKEGYRRGYAVTITMTPHASFAERSMGELD